MARLSCAAFNPGRVTLGCIFSPARHALDTGALHNTFHAGVVLVGVVKKCARAEATKAFYAQLTPEQ